MPDNSTNKGTSTLIEVRWNITISIQVVEITEGGNLSRVGETGMIQCIAQNYNYERV